MQDKGESLIQQLSLVFLHLSALSLGVAGEYVISSGSSPPPTLPNPVKGTSEETLSAGDLIWTSKWKGRDWRPVTAQQGRGMSPLPRGAES